MEPLGNLNDNVYDSNPVFIGTQDLPKPLINFNEALPIVSANFTLVQAQSENANTYEATCTLSFDRPYYYYIVYFLVDDSPIFRYRVYNQNSMFFI